MAFGMTRDELQESIDRQFPSGTLVWMMYGTGSDPFSFNIPRPIVLDDSEILLSAFDGEPMYFVLEPDKVTVEDGKITINQGSRIVRLTAATDSATASMSEGLSRLFRPGMLEFLRKETDESPEEPVTDPETLEEGTQKAEPDEGSADDTVQDKVLSEGAVEVSTGAPEVTTPDTPQEAPEGPVMAAVGEVSPPTDIAPEEEVKK